MAMTKESKVKETIKKILADEGIYYFMPSGNGYGRSAIPDFVCCVNGKFLAIEAKADALKPTLLQARELSRIFDAGGTGIYVNATNVDQLPHLLKGLKNDSTK